MTNDARADQAAIAAQKPTRAPRITNDAEDPSANGQVAASAHIPPHARTPDAPSPRIPRQAAAPRRPSRALLRFFDTYLTIFVKRHFHAIRLAGAQNWPQTKDPLIVCLNHPSWWDPLTALLISRMLARPSDHYAPIDSLAFRRYGILGKIGLFPVEQGTARGGAQFLRASTHLLADPRAVLWLTPQGAFTDARTRPVTFRPGLDALLRRTPQVTVLPLALEYTFWDERLPEALALLGEPLHFSHGTQVLSNTVLCAEHQNSTAPIPGKTAPAPGEAVAAALTHTQDALALLSHARDPALFRSVLSGASGTSGIYGAWQHARALLRREPYQADHGSLHAEPDPPRG